MLNGANVTAMNPKGKLPRDLTSNTRIQYLLDKELSRNGADLKRQDSCSSSNSAGVTEALEMSFASDEAETMN